MAATTPLTIGAHASCTDGACGKVSQVVMDPVARAVTHLVIDRRGLVRLVPLDLVDATAGEVRLRCTKAEFEQLEPADTTQFLPGSSQDPDYGPDQVLTMPYYGPADRYGLRGGRAGGGPLTITYDTLPLGEVAVRRDEQVHATDGNIGQVQGLVIDPASRRVTHVLLQEGHVWGRKEVAIPIGAVSEVDDAGVRLSISSSRYRTCRP